MWFIVLYTYLIPGLYLLSCTVYMQKIAGPTQRCKKVPNSQLLVVALKIMTFGINTHFSVFPRVLKIFREGTYWNIRKFLSYCCLDRFVFCITVAFFLVLLLSWGTARSHRAINHGTTPMKKHSDLMAYKELLDCRGSLRSCVIMKNERISR